MKRKNYLVIAIVIGLVLSLLGFAVSHNAKTNFGQTEVTEIKTISPSGYEQSMEVYMPKGVSAENPAPAILVQHGGNNNKEEMELYAIELSRRGYVVISNDMYGMGKSEVLPDSQWLASGRGLYDAVKYARTLPFVDKDSISLLGYSRGGIASSESLRLDQENNYIKNIFIIHADSYYANDEGYYNWYGDRNVAIVADKYDEFFFVFKNFAGGYSNDANKYAAVNASSVGYIDRDNAQSFLYFGENPEEKELRKADTIYEKELPSGKVASRVIYVTEGTHMTAWYSSEVVEKAVSFFQRNVPTETPLANNDFIYWTDNIFSLIGIFGLLIFLVSFAIFMVAKIPAMKDAYVSKPELKETGGKKGLIWFWGMMGVITVVSILFIRFLNVKGISAYRDIIFRSANPVYHGVIGIMCGTLALLAGLIWYQSFGKKNKFDLRSTGVLISKKQLLKTILVAFTSVAAMYTIVFIANHLFGAELLFIYWHIIPFAANRVPGMLAVLPLFIIFYVTLSISVNCFNFTKALSKIKWLNHILISFIAIIPTLFVIVYAYSRFYATGHNPMFGGLASAAVAILPLPAFIFFAVLASRVIYSKTGNPYLGGIISGIMASIIEWSVCEIRMPEPGGTMPMNPLVYTIMAICLIVFIGSMVYINKTKSTEKSETVNS